VEEKMKMIIYKTNILVLIVAIMSLGLPAPSNAMEEIKRKIDKYYKFDTWPKSDKQPIVGFKMNNYAIDGFTFKTKKHHAPTGGMDYIWVDNRSKINMHVIINVYQTTEKAKAAYINWLAVGVNAPLKKGTFSSSSDTIGDISWCDTQSSLLSFQRDNVFIITRGQPFNAQNLPVIEEAARNIDDVLIKEDRSLKGAETIKKIQPVIRRVDLKKTSINLNEKVLITVETMDPRGERVEYYVKAGGGNIVRTKQGYMYEALKTGKHTITVFAVNESNIRNEKSIDIVVTEK
jgi:hypothetical protein